MTDNFEQLCGWVGRKEIRRDVVASWPVTALAATVDDQKISIENGKPLPPGWHWIYFLEAKPPSEVGVDGHPKRGGFLPPVPLPRRMWAGGRIEFLRPLVIGDNVTRESEIVSVEPKSGRSGTLVFVTVRHTIAGSAGAAIVEEQNIVYREAAKKGDPMPPGKLAPASAQWTRRVVPDAVMLFRYSALTFNGHRIHYDKDYAINDEHYPGLVVHGPLQATLLLDLCRQNAPAPIKKFEYRAQHPIFAGHAFTVNGRFDPATIQADMWTASEAGNYAMRGTAFF
ncbi:MAG: MaoC family dehydratase N-terminal domain-containing protein [Betaproteobacteria bacterium]|nr:MaoC family dehydratase N-terminal domain-containing protein [Betaproteobacteria bacterium]